jgi:ATP phosphoribosyltransferase regulatory subunit
VREAPARIAGIMRAGNVDISPGLDAFQRRLDLIAKAGVDLEGAEFSAEFGRNLEYYTGFVFEVIAASLGAKSPLAGGGRYDELLSDAGAPVRVPAVGASIHTERLLAVLQGAAP